MYEKFPTPLINRLEKHFVLTSSVLKDWQQTVLVDFESWIKNFSGVRYACILCYTSSCVTPFNVMQGCQWKW